jgi:hypothetical protein
MTLVGSTAPASSAELASEVYPPLEVGDLLRDPAVGERASLGWSWERHIVETPTKARLWLVISTALFCHPVSLLVSPDGDECAAAHGVPPPLPRSGAEGFSRSNLQWSR